MAPRMGVGFNAGVRGVGTGGACSRSGICRPQIIISSAVVIFVLWLLRFAALAATPGAAPPPALVRALAATLLEGSSLAGREVVSLHAMIAAERAPGAAAARGGEAVTAADAASGAVFAALDLRGAAVVSEEALEVTGGGSSNAGEAAAAGLVVYVDPLDATQEYTESLTQFVSLQTCVTACGRTLAAAVYFPFSGRTLVYGGRAGLRGGAEAASYDSVDDARRAILGGNGASGIGSGSSGGGCACPASAASPARVAAASAATDAALVSASIEAADARRARLRAALPASLRGGAPLRLVVTRSHLRSENRSETGLLSLRTALRALRAALPPGALRLTRAGGAGYKLAAVMEGEHDAYIHDGPIRQWDVCAGGALVRGAGGAVSDWTGADHVFCLPSRTAAAAAGKGAFAVQGIVAARDRMLHAALLDVIRGAFGDGAGSDGDEVEVTAEK